MKRTRAPKKQIQVLSEVLSRASLASRLGYQYGGDRDIYDVLGYKKELTYKDYYTQYARQDVAKAVINRPVEASWRGDITVIETDIQTGGNKGNIEFNKAWEKLEKALNLKSKFIRLDKLSLLGNYGVFLLGLDDVRNKDNWKNPVSPGKRKLKFVKPLGEGSATIKSWDTKSSSERFGSPVMYEITVQTPGDSASSTLLVHYTRVMHVAGELLESEVDGVPYLQPAFNRLKDLEKIVGGSAEMFWRGARPGYNAEVKDGYSMTPASKADLDDQFDEYENDLRRFLQTDGIDIKELAGQVSDPETHVNVQLKLISAVYGIPLRILTGSERGELASTQDKDSWLETVQARREEYAEPTLINPFVNLCMEYGILPRVESYDVKWADLFAPSAKTKVEIGKFIAEALKLYSTNMGAVDIVPPKAFLKLLGLSTEQVEMVEMEMESETLEEENLARQLREEETTIIEEE